MRIKMLRFLLVALVLLVGGAKWDVNLLIPLSIGAAWGILRAYYDKKYD